MSFAARTLTQAVRNLDLKGIYVPLITPFDSQGDIDYKRMEKNIAKFEREVNLTGYIVGGSNSEVASLSHDERIDLVGRVRKLVKPSKMIIGGAFAESTRHSCDMCVKMASAGADGVLILPPHYFRRLMTEDVIEKYFTTVADKSPISIVIYNNTSVSGIDVSINLLKKLAKHPNIRGIKDSDIRKMGVVATEIKGENFDVLAASIGYLLPAMQAGCSGGMVALAGPLGPECCKLYELITQKKWDEAIELQNRLIQFDSMIYGTGCYYGVPGLKAAMDMKGYDAGHCRSPLEDVSEDVKKKLRQNLIENGFL